MSNHVLVNVERVSKKYCRSLKRSLWYGVQDVSREFLGRKAHHNGLRKEEFWAVNDVSFELKRGECLGLIGPNGAGKSTLLKMLNGLVKPDKGRIEIRGKVGALIELGAGFNPILTARENIFVNGTVLGFKKREIEFKFEEIVAFSGIDKFVDTPVQNFSSGMRVRLGFAVAAMLEPHVLLIDEVLAVGDARFRMKCYEHLIKLKDKGTAIIVVSHAVNHLSRITRDCMVLNAGRNLFCGEISTAISMYEEQLLGDSLGSGDITDTSASIHSVTVFNRKGEACREFTTGETVHFEIICKSKDLIRGARLIVSVESPTLGILGSFSTPYSKFCFDVTPPEIKVKLTLPSLPLLVGTYFLNISLYGPGETDYVTRSAPATSFSILGPPTNEFGYGLSNSIAFEHAWKLVKNNPLVSCSVERNT